MDSLIFIDFDFPPHLPHQKKQLSWKKPFGRSHLLEKRPNVVPSSKILDEESVIEVWESSHQQTHKKPPPGTPRNVLFFEKATGFTPKTSNKNCLKNRAQTAFQAENIWVFPKIGVPPKHPKMIIFSRKTHGCWVPPFMETSLYVFLEDV